MPAWNTYTTPLTTECHVHLQTETWSLKFQPINPSICQIRLGNTKAHLHVLSFHNTDVMEHRNS